MCVLVDEFLDESFGKSSKKDQTTPKKNLPTPKKSVSIITDEIKKNDKSSGVKSKERRTVTVTRKRSASAAARRDEDEDDDEEEYVPQPVCYLYYCFGAQFTEILR